MTTANDSRTERNDKPLTEAELAQQEEAIIEQASLTARIKDSTRISKKIMATEKINDAFTEQGKESDIDVQVMPIINKSSREEDSKKTDGEKSAQSAAQPEKTPSDSKKEEEKQPEQESVSLKQKQEETKAEERQSRNTAAETSSESTSAAAKTSQPVVVKTAPQVDSASASALAYELRSIRRRTGMLSALIILVCLGAAGGFFYLTQHQQISNTQLSAEQMEVVKAEQAKLAQAYADIANIKNDIQDLKNVDSKNAEFQPVVSNNSEKLEELSASQKQNSERLDKIAEQLKDYQSHNPNDWRIAQAYFLVNSAFQMGIFEKDTKAAAWCLKNADDQIAGIEDPELIKIREAISHDLMTLASLPTIDTRGIIYRIDSVYDNLNLMPLKDAKDPAKRTADQQETSAKDDSLANWKNNLLSSLQDFSSRFVEIRRRTDPNVNEFLSPEQISILRQNIQSELLMAKLAVYHRNDEAFRTNITQAQKLIENYFDNNSDIFKANITALKELKELRVAIETPDVLSSYSLFSDYAQKKLRFNMISNAADVNASEVKREAK